MREAGSHSAASSNPAMLKVRLALEGLNVPGAGSGDDAVELALEDEIAARARIDTSSALTYLERGEQSAIQIARLEYPARIVSLPEFTSRTNARGVSLGAIAQVRGLYALVALGGGCGLGSPRKTCALCMGRELTEKAGEWWEPDEVVEAVRAVFEEGAAEFVHFNVGYLPGDDAGVERLRPYIDAVQRHLDATICVTMHPPAALRAIDRTYAMGVDVISYNVEAPDAATLEHLFPGRARFFGRERYLAALGHGAKVFPRGAVWSELLADVAPAQLTSKAIADLTSVGVTPLLGFSGGESKVAAADLAPVCAMLFESALKAGLNMSWARNLSTALTPLEARNFVAGAAQLPVLLNQISKNRLGALAARSLARLRRRLRVRRARASFDSSRL